MRWFLLGAWGDIRPGGIVIFHPFPWDGGSLLLVNLKIAGGELNAKELEFPSMTRFANPPSSVINP